MRKNDSYKKYRMIMTAAATAAVLALSAGCSSDVTDKVVSKAEDAYSRIDGKLTDDGLAALDGFIGEQAEILKNVLGDLYDRGISAEKIVDIFTGRSREKDPAAIEGGGEVPVTGRIVEEITSKVSDAAKEAASEAVNGAADAAQEAVENAVQDMRDSIVDKVNGYIDEVFD